MPLRFLIVALLVAALAIAGLVWWQSREAAVPPEPPDIAAVPEEVDEEVAPTPAPEPPPAIGEPEEEELVLPALDESDGYVRERLLAISPELSDWLDRDQLLRRLAVVMDSAAIGEYPRRQLRFLAPSERFPVIASGNDRFLLDPKGYARYDGFVAVFTSVPPADAAALLTTLAPLLRQALAELGQPDDEPLAIVREAITVVLATPELDAPIELVQPKVMYKFADPALEALPPLQKQLFRMGPEHVRRIKVYLREVEAAL